MSDLERKFHETWLGMAQPSEGLVVSVPVLIEAQCMQKQERQAQEALLALAPEPAPGTPRLITDAAALYRDVLDLPADLFDSSTDLPKPLRLYVAEGKQELRPTRALKRRAPPKTKPKEEADLPAAALAGQQYSMLVWEVPPEVDLDKPETITGPWEYPAQAKFDRLLRECRVPIGLLNNGRELRLVYAPHGESSGWLSFRIDDMASVGGRPIFDAFVMLLGRVRWFGVSEEQQLPALLEQSRRRQANVTNDLSSQVFEALEALLAGFSAAAERDPQALLRRALEEEEDGHVYSGLLTVLLRLVFTLYCEDRGLLPVENELYARHYSVLGLYEDLERDQGRYPDSMDRRYGAYARLVSLFRAIYLGVGHGPTASEPHSNAALHLPPRHGDLFDPQRFPFLEGWGAGSVPIVDAEARAAVTLPAISDGTIYRVLEKLIVLDGQRLSYRALDVEQIGSVYEALMGFNVERLVGAAVRLKLSGKRHAAHVWLEARRVLELPANRRASFLQDDLGFDKGLAAKIETALKAVKDEPAALTALEPLSGKSKPRAPAGALVIQPGPERRRTSSHYTPRELSEAIVRKTLDPLIRSMGERPRSEALLNLVICDPAVGSGAFLVAACRYLADHVVAAWTRESAEETASLPGIGATPSGSRKTKLQLLADAHEDVVNHARRLVAQRCLYGVDKNKYAVDLARLSLWLVTMAKHEPFSFVDHAIRHGDSLVGLSFAQIRAFHWKTGHKGEQIETTSGALKEALDEAILIRQQIQALAADGSPEAQRNKERLLDDATDATQRVRLIADLIVGAFFAGSSDKEREKERARRLDLVKVWLGARDTATAAALETELIQLQAALRATQVPFHWMIEFPEVFYLERPDPLDGGKVNGAAMVEAFVGNPPFAGGLSISGQLGNGYIDWGRKALALSSAKADLSAYFFVRCASLLGDHGTIGLLATHTIAQGDSREAALVPLIAGGLEIYEAVTGMPWPGEASLTVAVVHFCKGRPTAAIGVRHLDGTVVSHIDSFLSAREERGTPVSLGSNKGLGYQGSIFQGSGFVLERSEAESLLASEPNLGGIVRPYVGGSDVNTNPVQAYERFVINFGMRTLVECNEWPRALAIVRERVKPTRDMLRDDQATARKAKELWWRFWAPREDLYAAIAELSRCLVIARDPKHFCFSYQPVDRIFNEKLCVFPFDQYSQFAALQNRLHIAWAVHFGRTTGGAGTASYSLSACFGTFPFPTEDPRTVIRELEAIGEQLYGARAAYMIETDQGLTKTYNALKDPTCTDARILALRTLHEHLDAAVLAAYGWQDLKVPPYCLTTPTDRTLLTAFEDEILDRLFLLNAQRAKKEALLGSAAKKGGSKKGGKTAAAKGVRNATAKTPSASSNDDSNNDDASDSATATKGKRGKKRVPEGQGNLGLG